MALILWATREIQPLVYRLGYGPVQSAWRAWPINHIS
jgi:hypothetical protein